MYRVFNASAYKTSRKRSAEFWKEMEESSLRIEVDVAGKKMLVGLIVIFAYVH